jgi:hypothetical protein
MFPKVKVTLKTADALLILKAGRRLPSIGKQPGVIRIKPEVRFETRHRSTLPE